MGLERGAVAPAADRDDGYVYEELVVRSLRRIIKGSSEWKLTKKRKTWSQMVRNHWRTIGDSIEVLVNFCLLAPRI